MYDLTDSLSALRDSVSLNSSLLHEIRQNTLDTVNNTAHTWLDEQWCLYGICALLVSVFTLIPLWTEFKKDRIDKKCQTALFKDILRHLYRNKVCVIAMKLKFDRMCRDSATLQYPSDEHFLKLELLPDDIHVEQFYRDHTKFAAMHNMALLLRNYNTEIGVALKHITDPHIQLPVIERDFTTLNFKPGHISDRICDDLGTLGFANDVFGEFMAIVKDEHKGNLDRNTDENLWGYDYEQAAASMIAREKAAVGDGYNKLLKLPKAKPEDLELFYDMMLQDVLIECGKNSKGSPKIGIVTTDLAR